MKEIIQKLQEGERIYIYPSHAEKGVIAGFGVLNSLNVQRVKRLLVNLGKDLFKFYKINENNEAFVFLGTTFFIEENSKPFIIDKNGFKYEVTEDKYYDENINSLNPLLHLVDLMKFDKKEVLFKATRYGFLTQWKNLNELELPISQNIVEILANDLNVRSYTRRALQKMINKAVNNFVNTNIELFRDLYSISLTSDQGSPLITFRYLRDAVTNLTIKKRIEYKEFLPRLIIKDMEVHFKILVPKERERDILKSLKNTFKSVKVVYNPHNVKDFPRKSKLYTVSIIVDLNREYYKLENTPEFEKIVDKVAEEIEDINKAWKLSKRYMWVKRISIEVITPPHFKEYVFSSLSKIKWPILLREEKLKDNKLILTFEIWCNYPIFIPKPKKEVDVVIKSSEIEKIDEKAYIRTFPANFMLDCAKFYTSLHENLLRNSTFLHSFLASSGSNLS